VQHKINQVTTWHNRFGHINFESLGTITRKERLFIIDIKMCMIFNRSTFTTFTLECISRLFFCTANERVVTVSWNSGIKSMTLLKIIIYKFRLWGQANQSCLFPRCRVVLDFALCSFCRPCPRYGQAGYSTNSFFSVFLKFPYYSCNVGRQNCNGQGCLFFSRCLYG